MRILIVDAGNYSRSPAAEILLRAELEKAGLAGRVAVASAGLKDKHAGTPPDPRTIARIAARGFDLGGFRCRQVMTADLTADAILVMDRATETTLMAMTPPSARKRVGLYLAAAGGGEVPDPYYGDEAGFDAAIDAIARGAAAIAQAVGAGRSLTRIEGGPADAA